MSIVLSSLTHHQVKEYDSTFRLHFLMIQQYSYGYILADSNRRIDNKRVYNYNEVRF